MSSQPILRPLSSLRTPLASLPHGSATVSFAGQGAQWLDTLAHLAPRVEGGGTLVTQAEALLEELAQGPLAAEAGAYPEGAPLRQWMTDPSTRPEGQVLAAGPLSQPMIFLTQMLRLRSLLPMGLAEAIRSGGISSVIGHSQGMVAAAFLAATGTEGPTDPQILAGIRLMAIQAMVMDAAWQQRLFYQVKDTQAQFSGLTSDEKLRIGPDAKIVAFVETLREHIPEGARIFVLSDDDYEGLRTAYYLYPSNVYFRMKYGLPSERRLIRTGDYIAVMTSPDTRYNKKKEHLYVPASGRWDVDKLVDERVGQLFRVR